MENRKVKVKVTHLTKKFGDLLVLNDVSFDVYDGEFLCIVGPTGCGKTTFLNSLTHLYEPTAGNILLDGEEIDLRKHNIAYIFQEYSAMEWLTASSSRTRSSVCASRPKQPSFSSPIISRRPSIWATGSWF